MFLYCILREVHRDPKSRCHLQADRSRTEYDWKQGASFRDLCRAFSGNPGFLRFRSDPVRWSARPGSKAADDEEAHWRVRDVVSSRGNIPEIIFYP